MKPKVVIDNEVYRKVMHWINKSKYEVSGLGTLKIEENGLIRVTSAMLLPQTNGGTHTDIEADAVCKAMYDLRAAEGELKWWWHSHVDFNVFWSGTDMDTIKSFGGGGWILATVLNQKNAHKSALFHKDGITSPFGKEDLFWDDLETSIMPFVEPSMLDWNAEYEKNVSHKVFIPATYPMGPVTLNPLDMSSAKRPPGISKREWKKIKKQEEKAPLPNLGDYCLDDYGFDSTDWGTLNEMGYSRELVSGMDKVGFSPTQILLLAEAAMAPLEVMQCYADGMTVEDLVAMAHEDIELDDVPVMDRATLGYMDYEGAVYDY